MPRRSGCFPPAPRSLTRALEDPRTRYLRSSSFLAGAAFLAGCAGGPSPSAPTAGSTQSNASSPARAGADAFAISTIPGAPAFETLHRFAGGTDGQPTPGLLFTNGKFYGTTSPGEAANGCGSVYSLTPNANFTTFTFATLYRFQNGSDGCLPSGSLIAIGSDLYGVTLEGGAGNGTVYKLPFAGGSDSVLYAFVDASGGELTGSLPEGPLAYAGGFLYGTTSSGGGTHTAGGQGTLFRVPLGGGSVKVLHSFANSTGQVYVSNGGVIDVNGTIYGVSTGGSTYSEGLVFAYPLPNGPFSVLYENPSGPVGGFIGGLVNVGSNLYGVKDNMLSSLPLTGGAPTTVYTFASKALGVTPDPPLTVIGNTFYGVTYRGGSESDGVLYSLPVGGGTETLLHNFVGGVQGRGPVGGLIAVNGSLFGSTLGGGTNDNGTLYEIALPASASNAGQNR